MAIKSNGKGIISPGTVEAFGADLSLLPFGYLLCDGSEISQALYPTLYAKIGTIYGTPANPANFVLPDHRGVFLRGFDDGRGIDSGRVLGTFQDQDIRSHVHSYQAPLVNLSMSSGGSFQFQPLAQGTGLTGGAETRPRNVSTNYIIKT